MGNRLSVKKLIVIAGVVLLSGVSCNKRLDVKPVHHYGEDVAWDSFDDINSNFFGVYSLFRATLANNNNYLLWGELRQGDFAANGKPDLKAVIDGELNAQFPLLEEAKDWRSYYALINAINLFIERSPEALVDGRYNRLTNNLDIAHMRCLRAWAYFMVVRIWGDAPFIVSSFDGLMPKLPRTGQRTILEFCEAELLDAVDFLPYVYGGSDPLQSGLYHLQSNVVYQTTLFGKLAAYALLAHIAAWQQHYVDAEVYARAVLNQRSNGRLNNFSSVPQIVASNGIFYDRGANNDDPKMLMGFPLSWSMGETGISGNGHIESWTMAAPYTTATAPVLYVPADTAISMFVNSTRDDRFRFDTIPTSVTDSSKRIEIRGGYFDNQSFFAGLPIFTKIKVFADGSSGGDRGSEIKPFPVYSSNIMFTRLEEISLLLAECYAVNGKQLEAIQELNARRLARGLDGYSAIRDGDLIDAVFAERRRELVGEAWRWYDLVRYKKIKRNDAKFNQLIDQDGIFWPVSKAVLLANPQISQTKYWSNR